MPNFVLDLVKIFDLITKFLGKQTSYVSYLPELFQAIVDTIGKPDFDLSKLFDLIKEVSGKKQEDLSELFKELTEEFKDATLTNLQDDIVVKYYTDFVGKQEVDLLTKQFDVVKFCDVWQQVLTSRTTGLFGTGITYSSVQATYTLENDGTVGVKNEAYDTTFNKVEIEGNSRARNNEVPTCRTVSFGTVPLEGDYWILYISPSFQSIIVGAPLITPVIPIDISNNFGVYVLTKDRDAFWKSKEETTLIFDALKKYGFTQVWNEGINSGKSFSL